MTAKTSHTLDGIPLPREDEISNANPVAWQMFWAFIAVFLVACSLAMTCFQAFRNEAAMSRENDRLRQRLFEAQTLLNAEVNQ